MKEQIIKIVRESMEREARDIAIFKVARAALAAFEGKPVSRRMVPAIIKALPGHMVYYDTNYGMVHLDIRPFEGAPGDGEKTRILLGYIHGGGTMPTFTMGRAIWPVDYSRRAGTPDGEVPGLDSFNVCHGPAAEERNARRAALLADPAKLSRLARTITAYNKARRAALAEIEGDREGGEGEAVEDWPGIKALMEGAKE